jgi:beta-N-acetylhexosaminidase
MAGLTIPMPREQAVPQVIAAGCDMFLFTRNQQEDYEFMKMGIENGVITDDRFYEALTKILGLKAALGLHKKKAEGTLIPSLDEALKIIGAEEHKEWALECADKAVTLVKEEKGLLPLTPAKHKRVLLYPIESGESFFQSSYNAVATFKELLENEGFEVEQFDPSLGLEGLMTPSNSYKEKYDLMVYVANMATKSNQTTVRIEWAQPMGANVPIFMTSVPTIFVSVENPYHLLDVPRVQTYINGYSSSEPILAAIVDKLVGKTDFIGASPVDAYCGRWDTRL